MGRVNGFYVPKLYSDGNNGALYAWQDDRVMLNTQSAFVQHVTSAGTKLFPINGSEGSILQPRLHLAPTVCYSAATGETFMFWNERNTTQSLNGISGQKFSAAGVRQWGDSGKVFLPWDVNSMSGLNSASKDSAAVVYYNNIITGGTNCTIKSFKTNRNGVLQWGGSIITPSTYLSNKLQMVSTLGSNGVSKLAWQDARNDGGGIYAQNINFDGTFGNTVGVVSLQGNIPDDFQLYQNYPNPFNPVTNIRFTIPQTPLNPSFDKEGTERSGEGFVKLVIYDVMGSEVAVLVNQKQNAGTYEVVWNAAEKSSGIYYYTLIAGDFKDTKKLVLIK